MGLKKDDKVSVNVYGAGYDHPTGPADDAPDPPVGPLSQHELSYVLTDLADWQVEEGRALDRQDVEEQLHDVGYHAQAVLDQVWVAFRTSAARTELPPRPARGTVRSALDTRPLGALLEAERRACVAERRRIATLADRAVALAADLDELAEDPCYVGAEEAAAHAHDAAQMLLATVDCMDLVEDGLSVVPDVAIRSEVPTPEELAALARPGVCEPIAAPLLEPGLDLTYDQLRAFLYIMDGVVSVGTSNDPREAFRKALRHAGIPTLEDN